MIEIYTPNNWQAIFGGSPSLRIDDGGYIYTFKESTRIFGGTPCGKIEWGMGLIYGSDYAAFSRRPIGKVVTREDGTQWIYGTDYANFTAAPILYVKNGKIYTPEEHFRIFGGDPSGYIRDDRQKELRPDEQGRKKENGLSEAMGCLPGPVLAFLVIIAFALLVGLVDALRTPVVYIPLGLGVASGLITAYFVRKKKNGGSTAGRSRTPWNRRVTPNPRETGKHSESGTAKFLRTADGKAIFACPHCNTNLAVPVGLGNVTIKCVTCGRQLSARS